MGEVSFPWGGTTVGDADQAPYDDDEWSDIWRKLFDIDRTERCVLESYANELEITTDGSADVQVNTGAAIVDGKFYENDASVDVAIPTPTVSTRYDRIVLEKDFSAQTVRITRIAGVEGAGVPAITQNDGVTWDVAIATVKCTTGGVITIDDDERQFARSPLARDEYGYFYLPAGSGQPATTDGCDATQLEELATNDVDIAYLAFDSTDKEYAVWSGFRMPLDWDGGVINAAFDWLHDGASTYGVAWGMAARAWTNDDALDQAFGAAQEIVDVGGTDDKLYQSAFTPDITVGGSPDGGQFAIFKAHRDPDNGSDNCDVDALLLGALVRYRRN